MKTSGMMLTLTLALLGRAATACDPWCRDICCNGELGPFPNANGATQAACIENCFCKKGTTCSGVPPMTMMTAEEAPCCIGACPVAGEEKYWSLEVRSGVKHCGEMCMNPKDYGRYRLFEKNLTRSDTVSPCVGFGYTNYDNTHTHGFGALVKITVDSYNIESPKATLRGAINKMAMGLYNLPSSGVAEVESCNEECKEICCNHGETKRCVTACGCSGSCQTQEEEAAVAPVTTVGLYWESAGKCGLLNDAPPPSLSGAGQLSTTDSTGADTKQTTDVVASSTDPTWQSNMQWTVADFDNVSPKLKVGLWNGEHKDHSFVSYSLIDLKALRASGVGSITPKLTVQSSSSNLAQKPELDIFVTFS